MKSICIASIAALLASEGEAFYQSYVSAPGTALPTTFTSYALPNLMYQPSKLNSNNYLEGFYNNIAGERNAAIGNQNYVYGLNSFVQGDRNAAKGIANVGIGQDHILLGSNNFA